MVEIQMQADGTIDTVFFADENGKVLRLNPES
jgi:hypothetical protein